MPRNVSGTYSLPLPPVVPNTVIQSAWANTTTDDIAQGITDSLDRNGRGGMIAPFRLVDGTVLQPAFAFASETGTGLYKASAGVMGVSVMGVQVAQWSGTAYSVLKISRAAATVAAMSSSLCAALTKPASYSAGAMYTPRSSRPWNSLLKRALSVVMTVA